uniref:Helicase ATP-binding domain-containing protein n=1 Tax=Schistocephalus solidus TaxID=70667 RepID=A0A0X3PX32_SCHSO
MFFFNKSSSTICFEDRSPPHKRSLVDADLSDAAFFLYGASASCFVLFASVDVSLRIDVSVKESHIFSTMDFMRNPLNPTQFEKVVACVTLQKLTSQGFLDSFHLPLYAHDMETQEEFVCSLKVAYSCIQRSHSPICNPADRISQPNQVKIKLLDYQLDAIRWMLTREAGTNNPVDANWIKSFFVPVTAVDAKGGPLYFSSLTGHFVKAVPDLDSSSCLGGILADEMGLGKTLEIISLILLHPFTSRVDVLGRLYSLSRNEDLPSNCVAFKVGSCIDSPLGNAFTKELQASTESDDSTEPMAENCVDENLRCPCGGVPETSHLPKVSCTNCFSPFRQHVACVQYESVIYQPDGRPITCNYICPHCWSELKVHSKATLIVSPDHIFRQWQDELLDHVDLKNIAVVIYNGIDMPATQLIQSNGSRWPSGRKQLRQRSSRSGDPTGQREGESEFRPGFVQPSILAAADIVLTTYSIVQRELGWASVSVEQRTGLGHRPHLRTAQRYLTTPSPLACVIWWRLCLDEAQMVENVTSKTARMLSEVSAVQRWCVTGTPAEKSIDDFYGLLTYLRVEPFCHRHYWNCLLYQPFLTVVRQSQQKTEKDFAEAISKTSLVTVLSQILWRNTKSLVGNQLTLPTVCEKIHWVDFTSVERYIHDRVLSECAKTLREVFQEELSQPRTCLDPISSKQELFEKPLSALSGMAHWRLIGLVTRARQACTHASLVVLNASQRHGRVRPSRGLSSRAATATCGYDSTSVGEYSDYGVSADPTLQVSRSNRFHGTGCATMTEVIKRVIDETRQECESDYRSWVFSKNGTAGCFILKEKYIDAANCYRDVLQMATKLEKKYGVLSDWSQRLHAITNLNWLIQCCSVPFADYPLASDCIDDTRLAAGVCPETLSASTSEVSDLPTWDSLDPRVDRDLVTKAKLLRLEYLKVCTPSLSFAIEGS